MPRGECQIHCLNRMARPQGAAGVLWQRRNRLRRIFRRRWKYVMHRLGEAIGARRTVSRDAVKGLTSEGLRPGQVVRVRSKEEIRATLNRWDQLKGCSFTDEMWAFCGTRQRVLKRVERFLDERDYLVKKCNGLVILDRVMCEGAKDYGACDRSCFFFWREEWLEADEAP